MTLDFSAPHVEPGKSSFSHPIPWLVHQVHRPGGFEHGVCAHRDLATSIEGTMTTDMHSCITFGDLESFQRNSYKFKDVSVWICLIYFEEVPFVDFHPYDLQIEPERVTRVVFEGGQGIVQDRCQKLFLAEAHGQIFSVNLRIVASNL